VAYAKWLLNTGHNAIILSVPFLFNTIFFSENCNFKESDGARSGEIGGSGIIVIRSDSR
jgi:hypothetical protein